MDSQKKITLFLGVFTLSFVVFCFLLVQIQIQAGESLAQISLSDFYLPIFFLFLQIVGIVFSAIIPSSLFLIGIPIFVSMFAGTVIIDSLLPVLLLGLPFAYLFWSIRRNISNRIHINFSDDVRRPLTTFFLFLFFFVSFFIVPKYAEDLQEIATKWTESRIPAKMKTESGSAIPLNLSIQDIIEKEMESRIDVCQGDVGCEKMLREEVQKGIEEVIQKTPGLSKAEIEIDKPLASQLTGNMVKNTIPGLQNTSLDISIGFIWGFFAFLLLSPFAVIFSFLTMISLKILYSLLRLTGILHLTRKNVQQEVII